MGAWLCVFFFVCDATDQKGDGPIHHLQGWDPVPDRFPCKLKAMAALQTLPPSDVMSQIDQLTYQFYLRKFKSLRVDVRLGWALAKTIETLS